MVALIGAQVPLVNRINDCNTAQCAANMPESDVSTPEPVARVRDFPLNLFNPVAIGAKNKRLPGPKRVNIGSNEVSLATRIALFAWQLELYALEDRLCAQSHRSGNRTLMISDMQEKFSTGDASAGQASVRFNKDFVTVRTRISLHFPCKKKMK